MNGDRFGEAALVGVGVEQRIQDDLVPQRQLADAGLEDGLFIGRFGIRILQGDGQRAEVFQRGFDPRLLGGADRQGEFEPGHRDGHSVSE
jgi:hypothetical protein